MVGVPDDKLIVAFIRLCVADLPKSYQRTCHTPRGGGPAFNIWKNHRAFLFIVIAPKITGVFTDDSIKR